MGFLDNSSITVDAILTKRGREILSEGGDLNIVKFALSDEEVDYSLYDVTHPNGTDSYGSVIENMSLLEATPNRTNFRSFLVNQSLAGAQVVLDSLNYSNVDTNANIALNPSTTGAPTEQYTFTIENTNIVKFSNSATSRTLSADSVNLVAQSVNVSATTTVTIIGVTSGITNVVTISVKADPASNIDPNQRQRSTTARSQAASGAGAATGPGGTSY
tara:strand:+ start:100 stop:750 length:651 start_codon:yes stop_codon:yes gene_type:complete